MNCEEYQARAFYLAEEDPAIQSRLEAHLLACAECSRIWNEYRLLISVFVESKEHAPEFRMPEPVKFPWRLMRVAAVIVVAVLVGVFWPPASKNPETPVSRQNQSLLGWDPPAAVSGTLVLQSPDSDFHQRVNSLQDGITRLRQQVSSNQF